MSDKYPLSQEWERGAAKELVDILQMLAHGLFMNASDLGDRLRQAADVIEETELLRREEIPPDESD